MKIYKTLFIVNAAIVSICCTSCGVDESTLSKIEVTTAPSKTNYVIGDVVDISGMVVTGYCAGDVTFEVKGYEYSPKDEPLKVGDNKITVEYKGFTATTPISVARSDYYSGIDSESSTLLKDLQELNRSKKKKTIGYSNMKTSSPFDNYKYTDYDPAKVKYDSKGQPYGTALIQFYQGTSATSGMNREHVWPNSLGGGSVEGDIHMPRPTWTSDNTSRGNEFYIEGRKGPTAKETGWDPKFAKNGDITYRGDSARIIFYCCVANSALKIIDSEKGNGKTEMGKLSDLLKWNLEYPVLEREQNRNSGAEYLQGNRNPFIDHPEYACKIWGNTNAATRKICGIK